MFVKITPVRKKHLTSRFRSDTTSPLFPHSGKPFTLRIGKPSAQILCRFPCDMGV